MRQGSVSLPGAAGKKSKHKHLRSKPLAADARLSVPPRFVEVVHQQPLAQGTEVVFLIKIYATSDISGSELMTLACVDSSKKVEVEMRYDEKYPMPIRFKKQSDQDRLASVCEQIKRVGGFEGLLAEFRSRFPEFGE